MFREDSTRNNKSYSISRSLTDWICTSILLYIQCVSSSSTSPTVISLSPLSFSLFLFFSFPFSSQMCKLFSRIVLFPIGRITISTSHVIHLSGGNMQIKSQNNRDIYEWYLLNSMKKEKRGEGGIQNIGNCRMNEEEREREIGYLYIHTCYMAYVPST